MSSSKTANGRGKSAESPVVRLRLFVAGDEPHSRKAKAVLTRLCNEDLKNRCEIHIVDVLEDFQTAIEHHVVAVPTLIVESPPPVRTIVGSLTDEAAVRAALGLGDPEDRA
jgi:circadian clock protein KaiB